MTIRRTKTMTRPSILLMVLATLFAPSDAFIQQPKIKPSLSPLANKNNSLAKQPLGASSLSDANLDSGATEVTTMMMIPGLMVAPSLFGDPLLFADDPLIGSQVLYGMAHVALDFTNMMSVSKAVLRLAAVVGRMFVMTADYLPDHAIHSEELVIQLFLMGVALKDLILEDKRASQET